jgi:hypothetical protein
MKQFITLETGVKYLENPLNRSMPLDGLCCFLLVAQILKGKCSYGQQRCQNIGILITE